MDGPNEKDVRVLSIQSHVVHGYCGNKSAVFPLQLAGFDVDMINAVQFSNHTGYPKWKGDVLTSEQIWKLYEGLCENSLNEYTHVLTGYIGSAASLKEIGRIVTDLKSKNPGITYVCDPVMGDNGKFYVHKDVLPVYKDLIIPLADVVTPNQFELEALTDLSVSNEDEILLAMRSLHDRGVGVVVVTSMNDQESENLIGYGSQLTSGNKMEIYRLEAPRIHGYFCGTGDLFASLLLMQLERTNNSLMIALENVLSSMQDVLKRTYEYAKARRGNETLTMKDKELRLIQSKNELLSPRSKVNVVKLDKN